MAGQINLIPEKRQGASPKTPLSRMLNKISVILVVIFVLLIAAGGGFWFIKNQELEQVTARNQELKNEVLALQQNEESLVLLRDRLDKAQGILADREQYKALQYFIDFVNMFPDGVRISEVSVEQGINKLTLTVSNSQVLSTIVKQLENSTNYSNISLESITYSSLNGYSVIISVL